MKAHSQWPKTIVAIFASARNQGLRFIIVAMVTSGVCDRRCGCTMDGWGLRQDSDFQCSLAYWKLNTQSLLLLQNNRSGQVCVVWLGCRCCGRGRLGVATDSARLLCFFAVFLCVLYLCTCLLRFTANLQLVLLHESWAWPCLSYRESGNFVDNIFSQSRQTCVWSHHVFLRWIIYTFVFLDGMRHPKFPTTDVEQSSRLSFLISGRVCFLDMQECLPPKCRCYLACGGAIATGCTFSACVCGCVYARSAWL